MIRQNLSFKMITINWRAKIIEEFEKMKLCDYLCSLNKKELVDVFVNLKKEIDL